MHRRGIKEQAVTAKESLDERGLQRRALLRAMALGGLASIAIMLAPPRTFGVASKYLAEITSMGTVPASLKPQRRPSYAIFIDGGVTKALNGATGTVDYSAEDASSVINACINALPQAGGIQIKAGTYSITQPIFLRPGIELFGDGDATVLKAAANVNVITIKAVKNTTVRNLQIDGDKRNGAMGHAIHIEGGTTTVNHKIMDVRIANPRQDGIHGIYNRQGTFQNVQIEGAGRYGVLLSNSQDCTFTDLSITNGSSHGIVLDNTRNTRIHNPYIAGHTSKPSAGIFFDGVATGRGYPNHVYGGIVENNYWGVLAWKTQYVNIDGLRAIGNISSGIRMDTDYDANSPQQFVLANCTAENNGHRALDRFGRSGIDVDDATKGRITSCRSYNNYFEGILLEGSLVGVTDTLVADCICSGNKRDGLRIGSISAQHPQLNNNIVGGKFELNAEYGIREISNVDYTQISGATVANNGSGAIALIGTHSVNLP